MNVKLFIKQYRKDWQELEQILRVMSKRKRNFDPKTLDRFEHLYQKTSQHLSYSQTYFPDQDITAYLNELVSRAHNLLYQDQVSSFYQVKRFFGVTFLRLLSEQQRMVFIAFLLFFIGTAGGFLSVLQDPLHLYSVLPDRIANAVDPERLGEGGGFLAPAVSASIMTNNIGVAFLAFAPEV